MKLVFKQRLYTSSGCRTKAIRDGLEDFTNTINFSLFFFSCLLSYRHCPNSKSSTIRGWNNCDSIPSARATWVYVILRERLELPWCSRPTCHTHTHSNPWKNPGDDRIQFSWLCDKEDSFPSLLDMFHHMKRSRFTLQVLVGLGSTHFSILVVLQLKQLSLQCRQHNYSIAPRFELDSAKPCRNQVSNGPNPLGHIRRYLYEWHLMAPTGLQKVKLRKEQAQRVLVAGAPNQHSAQEPSSQ